MRLVMSASLPPRRIFRRRALTTRKGPSALTSSCRRTSSSSTPSRSSSRRMPALQTSSSSVTPSSRWPSAATPASSVTPTPVSTRTPRPSSAGDDRRQAAITWRPSTLKRLQSARPMPRLAPTTRTVRADGLMRPSLAPRPRGAGGASVFSVAARSHRLGGRGGRRPVRRRAREELLEPLRRPAAAVAVRLTLLQIGRRLGLGLGGHALDPLEALLLGEGRLLAIEHERLRRGGGVLVVGDPPALVHLGQNAPHVAVPLRGERAVAVLHVAPLGRGQDRREER